MDNTTKTICPVCESTLDFFPWDGQSPSLEICPCCFIQFGYDDYAGGSDILRQEIYQAWRSEWIKNGSPKKWRPTKEETLKIIASVNKY